MDTLEAIRTRRSVGLSQGDVSRETISELIETATLAPNHKLTQPWRFTVVKGAARERLGEVWAREAAAGVDPAKRAAVMEGEARKPLRAPVVIAVSTRTDPNPVTAEEDLTATAAAVQNLLLAAHAKGLSAAWKTGKITSSLEVKRFLGLEPSDRIIAMVYLGAEGKEQPGSRDRRVRSTITWLDELALTV
ncbi:MAG: nitroreductase [Candidatus Lustribacter sp.]